MHPFFRRTWVAPALASALLAFGVFGIAFRYLFPYEDLARRLESRLRAQGIEARLEGLGPDGLAGFEVSRIVLGPVGRPDQRTELDRARIHVSFAKLLRMQLWLALETEACGGKFEARWPARDPREVEASWEDVELRRLPFAQPAAQAGLRGRATGSANLRSADLPRRGAFGYVETRIADAKLGPGDVVGMPVPAVSLGTGRLRLAAKGNRLEFEEVRFEGGNLDLRVTGNVGLAARFPDNPLDAQLALRPDERTAQDLSLFFALFPGSWSSDGVYTLRLAGNLRTPLPTPVQSTR